MEHVTFSDIATDDGKAKVLNDIIDELGSIASANEVYNAEVDEYNKEVDKCNKKIEKGGK